MFHTNYYRMALITRDSHLCARSTSKCRHDVTPRALGAIQYLQASVIHRSAYITEYRSVHAEIVRVELNPHKFWEFSLRIVCFRQVGNWIVTIPQIQVQNRHYSVPDPENPGALGNSRPKHGGTITTDGNCALVKGRRQMEVVTRWMLNFSLGSVSLSCWVTDLVQYRICVHSAPY